MILESADSQQENSHDVKYIDFDGDDFVDSTNSNH